MKHKDKIKKIILDAGVKIWHDDPLKVTARNVAKAINMQHGTVLYHFPEGIRNAIAEYAVKIDDSKIIVQLIACYHPSISKLPQSARKRHLSKI